MMSFLGEGQQLSAGSPSLAVVGVYILLEHARVQLPFGETMAKHRQRAERWVVWVSLFCQDFTAKTSSVIFPGIWEHPGEDLGSQGAGNRSWGLSGAGVLRPGGEITLAFRGNSRVQTLGAGRARVRHGELR